MLKIYYFQFDIRLINSEISIWNVYALKPEEKSGNFCELSSFRINKVLKCQSLFKMVELLIKFSRDPDLHLNFDCIVLQVYSLRKEGIQRRSIS